MNTTNYEYYKIFYYVASIGSITNASKFLGLTQPGVSKIIKALESNLNCKLFIRSKGGVTLTDNGKLLCNEIKNAVGIIDKVEKNIKSIANSNEKVINIGISKTLTKNFLLKYLNKFIEVYPDVKINIKSGSFIDKVNMVRNKELDFIVLKLPCDKPKDFEEIKLKSIHTVIAGNKKYKDLKEINLKDINNYPLILNALGATTRYYLDKLCESVGVKLNPKMEFTSTALVKMYIRDGYGIGPVTREHLTKEFESGELYEIKTIPDITERHIGIIYSKDIGLNNISKKFINTIQNDIEKD